MDRVITNNAQRLGVYANVRLGSKSCRAASGGATAKAPSPSIPDVPTVKEAGLDYEVPSWTAIYSPIQTPKLIIDKLAAAIR
jgi:tripartite-type tricarboxylate transporter receptor subunit TctC